jgi:hypothetical protein
VGFLAIMIPHQPIFFVLFCVDGRILAIKVKLLLWSWWLYKWNIATDFGYITTFLLSYIYCTRNKLYTFGLCNSTLKPILQKLFLFCYYVVCYYVKTTFFQVFQVLFSSNGAICLVVGKNIDGVQKRRYLKLHIYHFTFFNPIFFTILYLNT